MKPEQDFDWVADIVNHPHWPKMEALIFGDVQQLLNMSLVVRTECSPGVQSVLRKYELDVPQSQEEQLRTYLALRAVIGYMTSKKKQIDTFVKAHQEKVRKANREPQTTLQQGR